VIRHAFEQNSARQRSHFLVRPHGTLSLLTSEMKSAQKKKKLKTFYFSLAF